MAEENKIPLEIEVKGSEESIESFKDLKAAIKAAKDEQIKAASVYGESSKEFQKATEKVSKLKDKVEDLKSQYTDKHRDLMRMQLETEILERTAVYGLKIPDKQPYYIVDKVYDEVSEK